MSYVKDGVYVIEPETPGICELCGRTAPLRPFGPNRERICIQCGMKDPAATERKMREVIGKVDAVFVTPAAAARFARFRPIHEWKRKRKVD